MEAEADAAVDAAAADLEAAAEARGAVVVVHRPAPGIRCIRAAIVYVNARSHRRAVVSVPGVPRRAEVPEIRPFAPAVDPRRRHPQPAIARPVYIRVRRRHVVYRRVYKR